MAAINQNDIEKLVQKVTEKAIISDELISFPELKTKARLFLDKIKKASEIKTQEDFISNIQEVKSALNIIYGSMRSESSYTQQILYYQHEFEEELMRLILDNYTKIDGVEYGLYFENNGTQKLVIKRTIGEKLITKKYECNTGKLVLISTKRNNRLHSFNGNPCMARFKYRNKTTSDEKVNITILYCENGIIENYSGASEYCISAYGCNVINKSKKYFINNKTINEDCYKIVKDLSENGINIEKFYEEKNKFNFNSKQVVEAIERFNEHYKREDKELEKLKILVNLGG